MKETAKFKVLEVADRLSTDIRPPDLIIGCDTTVALGDTILGKPSSKDNAFEMLTMYWKYNDYVLQCCIYLSSMYVNNLEISFFEYFRLSGKSHTVYTGVVLKSPSKILSFCESTKVYFTKLTPEVIKGYIETGEPM